MCGIAGVVDASSSRARSSVLAMLDCLSHRGPDDSGVAAYPTAVLGARRLAIIDVAGGKQPVTNEDGSICVVQNGEIYNFRDLRSMLELRGHSFRSGADTEVLPHMYEEFGDEFPQHLRGMFAIAVWDEPRRRLLLARDRMGKKPLLTALFDGGVAFASEIQALLPLPIDRRVDDLAIAEYLGLGYVPSPHTGFVGIRKVRPGHTVVFSDGRLGEQRPYWRLAFEPKLEMSENDALEGLRERLTDAVRARLVSDVPLGAFLSGGLDSSSVVALMAANSDRPVKTFSIGFSDADFDELRYARLVAQRFATEHHEFVVEPAALDVLPMLVRHVGEPFADSSIIPSYYVARTARQHVTVALNGDGGDELFAGYDRYRAAQIGLVIEHLPRGVRRLMAEASGWLPVSPGAPRIVRRARRLGSVLQLPSHVRYLSWVGYFAERDAIYAAGFNPRLDAATLFGRALAEAQPRNELEQLMAIDMRNYLPDDLLVKMDIATMAASLEARSPFLDQDVVDFVTRLPARLKQRRGQSKYILRRLMAGLLPDPILRRRKMGFGLPVGSWMRESLKTLVYDCLVNGRDRGILERREVVRLVAEHMSRRADHSYRLWALLMLELWFRYVVEAQAPAASARTAVESSR
jgi:asparagine synthase (glutamine-hydrolysing)